MLLDLTAPLRSRNATALGHIQCSILTICVNPSNCLTVSNQGTSARFTTSLGPACGPYSLSPMIVIFDTRGMVSRREIRLEFWTEATVRQSSTGHLRECLHEVVLLQRQQRDFAIAGDPALIVCKQGNDLLIFKQYYVNVYFPFSMTLCAIVCRRATVLNGSYLHRRRRMAICERSMSPSLEAAMTILAALSILSSAPAI